VPGAFGVRGGFDSHAFPPFLFRAVLCALLVGAVLAGASPARAQQGEGMLRDSVRVLTAPPVTPAAAPVDSARRTPWHEQPRFVMARSLVIPGWGQWHNRQWFKALLVAGGEGYVVARLVEDQRALDRTLGELAAARAAQDAVREEALVNEYNARLDQRLGRQWLLGAVLAYALVDAYVDANFRGFDVEFKTDPALPAGPPSGPSGPVDGLGVRLLLRRHF
jgi:Family of unknown function (DUF5683)